MIFAMAMSVAVSNVAPLTMPPGRAGDALAAFRYFCAGSAADLDAASDRLTALHWTATKVPPSTRGGFTIKRTAAFRSPAGDMEMALTEGSMTSAHYSGPFRQCALVSRLPPPDPIIPAVEKWLRSVPDDSVRPLLTWSVPAGVIDANAHNEMRVLVAASPGRASALSLLVQR